MPHFGTSITNTILQGKTVQTVAVLEHLRAHQRVRGPFLVLAPLSTLGHWKREFEEWTDMNVVYYHDPQGGAEARALIREYEWRYPGPNGVKLAQRGVFKFNVLITSYHVFMADWEEFKEIKWKYVVVDEAHGEEVPILLTSIQNYSALPIHAPTELPWRSSILQH